MRVSGGLWPRRSLPQRRSSTFCKAGAVEAQGGPVERISAVTLVTDRMAEAVAFYQGVGFRLLYGGPQALFTSFQVGDGYLNLQAGPVALLRPGSKAGGESSSGSTTSTPCIGGRYRPGTVRRRRRPTRRGESGTFTSGIPTGTN